MKKPAVFPQRVLIVPNSNWLGQQVIITSDLLRYFAAYNQPLGNRLLVA
jgi:hypothetical protein